MLQLRFLFYQRELGPVGLTAQFGADWFFTYSLYRFLYQFTTAPFAHRHPSFLAKKRQSAVRMTLSHIFPCKEGSRFPLTYLRTSQLRWFGRWTNKLQSWEIFNFQSLLLYDSLPIAPPLLFLLQSSTDFAFNRPISDYNAEWQWWDCQNVTTLSAVQPANCQPLIQEHGPSDQCKIRWILERREREGWGGQERQRKAERHIWIVRSQNSFQSTFPFYLSGCSVSKLYI